MNFQRVFDHLIPSKNGVLEGSQLDERLDGPEKFPKKNLISFTKF